MTFANPLPWWGALLAIAAAAWLAWVAAGGRRSDLGAGRRAVLVGLRFLVLLLVVLALMRPVRLDTAANRDGTVVPLLIDASRSMRLADVDGRARIDVAQALARDATGALGARFVVELPA